MIRDYYAAGKLDELCNEFLNDSLDEDARRSLGVRQEQRPSHQLPRAATFALPDSVVQGQLRSLRTPDAPEDEWRSFLKPVFCSVAPQTPGWSHSPRGGFDLIVP